MSSTSKSPQTVPSPSARVRPARSARGAASAADAASASGIDIAAKLPLLGHLSPSQFMKRHWQKQPLLVRQALPGVVPPIDRVGLARLAASDEVESRLVSQQDGDRWSMRQGPIAKLPAWSKPQWTLLVQGLDLHVEPAQALLSRFRFIPEARLDDLMLSYASEGGGVGPHFDSYDVFLIQVSGRRHWRIGRLGVSTTGALREDLPLKVLADFEPEQEFVLEPGDMLYLPPGWAHDGVAVGGDCMTASVGFRSPWRSELANELLVRLTDDEEAPRGDRMYMDPRQTATGEPGRIPEALTTFAREAVLRAASQPLALERALGEALTEPKPKVFFEPGEALPAGQGARLSARSRMLYDAAHVFINGQSFRAGGRDATLMRRMADRRALTAAEVARLSDGARDLLDQWTEDGWVLPA
ncbi:cupin [Roseateles noduli]|nr:cupin [Roseateles noduli]